MCCSRDVPVARGSRPEKWTMCVWRSTPVQRRLWFLRRSMHAGSEVAALSALSHNAPDARGSCLSIIFYYVVTFKTAQRRVWIMDVCVLAASVRPTIALFSCSWALVKWCSQIKVRADAFLDTSIKSRRILTWYSILGVCQDCPCFVTDFILKIMWPLFSLFLMKGYRTEHEMYLSFYSYPRLFIKVSTCISIFN